MEFPLLLPSALQIDREAETDVITTISLANAKSADTRMMSD